MPASTGSVAASKGRRDPEATVRRPMPEAMICKPTGSPSDKSTTVTEDSRRVPASEAATYNRSLRNTWPSDHRLVSPIGEKPTKGEVGEIKAIDPFERGR